mgnify:CR=1 FL=1
MEVIGAKGEVEESWGGRKVPRQGRGADGCTEGADGPEVKGDEGEWLLEPRGGWRRL